MIDHCRKALCFALFLLTVMSGAPLFAQEVPESLTLEDIAFGLDQPTAGAVAGDGSGRLFIVEQTGQIHVMQEGELLAEPFLDIADRMVNLNPGYDERGLLGLAFHPDYEDNGRFYVYYSAPISQSGLNHQSVIAEFRVSDDDPNRADPESERVLLTFGQPEMNHNGGQMAFGTDGMLYIASGDGGGAGDQHGAIGNGQSLDTLLGKILRIDVDNGDPFAIPGDNPFLDNSDARDEIWAYGLRNPWRFSFDRGGDQRLFAADVGQNEIEEVNIIRGGENYGWRIMEGSQCFNPSDCDPTGLTLPIMEYPHSEGISVTGGYVYRGSQYASLYGRYVFGDFTGSMFIGVEDSEGNWTRHTVEAVDESGEPVSMALTAFAQDEAGELYVLYGVNQDFFGGEGRVARITVPGDEPVRVSDWRQYE